MGQNAISNNGQLISRLTVRLRKRRGKWGERQTEEKKTQKERDSVRESRENEADDGWQWSGTQQGKKRGMGNKWMRSEKWERLKKKLKSIEVCLWI